MGPEDVLTCRAVEGWPASGERGRVEDLERGEWLTAGLPPGLLAL